MVGYGFMGRAHSLAWREVVAAYDVALVPEMLAICGRDSEAVTSAAERDGWRSWATDWREIVEREDVGLVDVCTPGSSHPEIAIAALDAGKHVLCEKPLANTVAEAEAMALAAERAHERFGTFAMVGFNYRRVPALALARDLIAAGLLGRVWQVRTQYLQDWLSDPEAPLSWRTQKEESGSGALGDIGSHVVDLAQHLTGDTIAEVSALTKTFVTERPLVAVSSALTGQARGFERGPVTVDDAVLFLGRFSSGAIATFEATRMATGHKNSLRIEVGGERGYIAFDLERLNELEIYESSGPEAGPRRVLATEPEHPYLEAWWPPGHILGWDHTFIHEVRDLLQGIVGKRQPRPSFADGLGIQRVLAAVERSAVTGRWTEVAPALHASPTPDGKTPVQSATERK
jgi:predicted dehydrogenase